MIKSNKNLYNFCQISKDSNTRFISGFTLLETVTVILMIGILSAIAAPSWLSFVDVQRLNTAQSEVYSAMRQAQSEAKKSKLTWQASFREQNGVLQWAVHQAESEKFIPDTLKNNDNLWHNLHPNIRIYQERNDKDKSETTLPKESSQQVWRVLFNHQGCPVYKFEDQCTNTSLRTLGQITFYSQNASKAKRCVYISTILGAMRMGKNHQKANKDGKYCY